MLKFDFKSGKQYVIVFHNSFFKFRTKKLMYRVCRLTSVTRFQRYGFLDFWKILAPRTLYILGDVNMITLCLTFSRIMANGCLFHATSFWWNISYFPKSPPHLVVTYRKQSDCDVDLFRHYSFMGIEYILKG